MQSSSTRPRLSACWMMSALAIVTNLSPASSFAVAIASSTLPVKVVRGNRFAAFVGRRPVGHDDHWRAGGVVVAPAVGLVEQPTAGDQRAATGRELLQHRGAGGVDREAHALLCARHHDVAAPVPVEQLRRVVVGLGDEPVQRHAHVSQHLGHARTTRPAPPIHRSTTGKHRRRSGTRRPVRSAGYISPWRTGPAGS